MAEKKSKVSKTEKVTQRVMDAIEAVKNKDFNMYFFVADSKNIPNGCMMYMYQLAKEFNDKGYKVTMLYQLENEMTDEDVKQALEKNSFIDENRRFVGVGTWMGDAYASLPHMNIQKGDWKVGPSDFLFIPEAFASFMYEVFKNKIPCKRYVVVHSFTYITDFIPIGQQWATFGVDSFVATNEKLADRITEIFPYTKQHASVIPPYIPSNFRKPEKAKKLIVDIVAKKQGDISLITKYFYWKYPEYQFVSFRDVRNVPMSELSKTFQESCVTVWVDADTPFGYAAIESIRCGNILIGKIPNDIPEWMNDNNGLWFNNLYDVPDIIYKVIKAWMNDEIPENLLTATDEMQGKYTYAEFEKNVAAFAEKIIADRVLELSTVCNQIKEDNKQEK